MRPFQKLDSKKALWICVFLLSACGNAQDPLVPVWGVVDRDIASVQGFRYSRALADMEGSWTLDFLDEYIRAPRAFARGTTITVGVARDN